MEFEERYKIGQPIFEELFKLSSSELKAKMQDILGIGVFEDDFVKHGNVKKTIKNDVPYDIIIEWYNYFEISWWGITFHPEHGSHTVLREFDKYFKLQ